MTKYEKKEGIFEVLCYNDGMEVIMEKKKIENIKTAAIIILALVIVFGGSYLASEIKNYQDIIAISDIKDPDGEADLIDTSIDEYLSLKDGEEKSIIYVARPTCSYCQQQEPIMKNLAYLYDLEIHYLNTDELDEDGFQKLADSYEYFSGQWGTPVTLIVQNGEVIDEADGYTSKEDMLAMFKENGLVEE